MNISPALMERVDAGVEWADENIPDWREYVDSKKLAMDHADRCFLGQYWKNKFQDLDVIQPFFRAFGTYFDSDWDRARDLGFVHDGEGYPELNRAWQQKFVELGLLDGPPES